MSIRDELFIYKCPSAMNCLFTNKFRTLKEVALW